MNKTSLNNDLRSLSPGEIIEARSRLWRVDSIKENILEATPIDGLVLEQQKFYAPFEKIRKGKLLQPSVDIVGNLAQQKLLLKSYKLDLLHSTAPILSLQRSRVIPEEYQLVPLIMSMDTPKVRILIADDVGLGKTIEAGLIIKELLARNRAKRILVVCPANLREQWRNALDYFFHLDARIISTRHRRAMERELPPGTNPWEHYDILIASIDYVKIDPTRQYVYEQKWDVVVIDEAHNCAKPHQTQKGQRIDMERYEFAREISKKDGCRHLLLLTATPHNGYSDSYASLFAHLDMGLVTGPEHNPRIIKEKAKNHVCQRRREDVLEWIRSSGGREIPFPERDQREEAIPLSNPHMTAIKKVENFTKYLSNVANEEGKKYRRLMAGWTIMHFHKRALSSPLALVRSLQNRIEKVEKKMKDNQVEDTTGLTMPEAKAVALDEDPGEKLTDEEAKDRLERELFGTPETQSTELALLRDALDAAKKITPTRDQKLQRLKSILLGRLKIKPKLIVFTKYTDTLEYIEKEIEKEIKSGKSFGDTTVVTIFGEMSEGERKKKFEEFEDARKAVLIATDCISEGIDLQYMSSQLIHYELPWNPNRLEQRNGRIDRYGQREKEVYIRLLVMEDPLDAAILKVLIKKAEQIRKDYGFSPPFFGDDMTVIDLIREANLDISFKAQTSLLEFEGGKPKKLEINPFSNEAIQRISGESFYGQTKLDLKDVQKRLEETRKLFGSQKEIEIFVTSGLRLFRTNIQKTDELYNFRITDENLLAPGIEKEIRKVTFDPQRVAKNPRLTLIDLGHPLVRQLIEHIKVSSFEDKEGYGRTSYITTKAAEEVSAVYHLLARYSVETKPISILEEIVPIGLTVYGNQKLDSRSLEQLLKASPESIEQQEEAVKQTLKEAMGKDLDAIFKDAVEQRRSNLCIERRRLRERFEKEGTADWVKGIDKVSVASIDLLTVRLYYPVPGGV